MHKRPLLSLALVLVLSAVAAAQVVPTRLPSTFPADVVVPSIPFQPPAQSQVLAQFMTTMLANQSLPAAKRAELLAELDAASGDGGSDQAITYALVALYPDLGKALALLADEQVDESIAVLKTLAQAEDEYLAAHAEYYLARAAFMTERYEDALPLLVKLSGPEKAHLTMHAGEALFYRGVCHDRLIERTEAMMCFSTFLQQNPDASERLLVGAEHVLAELALLAEGSLWDVQNRMDFSRRHLDLEWSGDPTQQQQRTIIAMLDALIKEAEDKENNAPP